jgi:hypothetical protein
VLQTIDTPQQRAQLARAVLNLRDRGTVSTHQATAAIIDLADDTQTPIRSSLINAIFIKTGRIPAPFSLRLAA